jgi:mevalonate kinase
MQSFYSHGKLLLTAEYAVLKGAKALAIPCQKGQLLNYTPQNTKQLIWESFDLHKNCWFSASFQLPSFAIEKSSDLAIAQKLSAILISATKQNKQFLAKHGGKVQTYLEFDRNWGLGSSSSLISNIALWAQVNPYLLLEQSFGGSGYDLACAQSDLPLFYTRNNLHPIVESAPFDPPFKEYLFFVYLNKKQSSLAAINAFDWALIDQKIISKINNITEKIMECTAQDAFNTLLLEHEKSIGAMLKQTPVQDLLFQDFNGAIKSLGAWGGDFILASGNEETPNYFKNKGYETVVPYSEMIFKP